MAKRWIIEMEAFGQVLRSVLAVPQYHPLPSPIRSAS
jgi:hypothetical protein